MLTRTAPRRGSHGARHAGRRAANSEAIRLLARAGLAARGIMYVIVGWIAVEIAFGRSRQQADRTGALHSIGSTPVGGVLLWLLVIGFIGIALWQLSEALYDAPHWRSVYGALDGWGRSGATEAMHGELRRACRIAAGRGPEPTAAVIDSQSVKAAETVAKDSRGFDAGKKVQGR